MKTAVVYYSQSGNVRYVAEQIAEALQADLIPVTPSKAYPAKGFGKFLHGGRSALMGEAPALDFYSFDPTQYDLIVLGTPIWAGQFTPPLRTVIRTHGEAMREKKLAAFASSGGGTTEKGLAKLAMTLGINGFDATFSTVDPLTKSTPEKNLAIQDFCEKLKALG